MSDRETQVGNVRVCHTPSGYWTPRVRVYLKPNEWHAWLWCAKEVCGWWWWLHGDGDGDGVGVRHSVPPSTELLILIEHCHETNSVALVADKVLEEYPETELMFRDADLTAEVLS